MIDSFSVPICGKFYPANREWLSACGRMVIGFAEWLFPQAENKG